MSLKKILIILIILLIIVIGALVAYNFLSDKEPASPSDSDSGQVSDDQAPDQTSNSYSNSKVVSISQEAILSPTIDGKKVKYYSMTSGNVYESNFDGSELTRLSSAILTNFIKVLWSPDKSKVIAIFNENGQAKKYFYNYNTKISIPLDLKMGWVSWAPNQDRITYQYYNSQTEDNNISIAKPDGSDWNNIFQTRMKDLIVEWPDPSKITLRTKPSGLAQSVVYTIDLTNNNFQKIIDETYGLTVLWSPLGDKILFSETDSRGKNLKLKIADLKKQTITELNITTLPEKCVWSQDNRTIFCAAPKTIPNSTVLPDDFYKGAVSFNDEFWQLNLETEKTVKILEAKDSKETTPYNAKELLLPPLEDYLLFINQKDGFLYSLPL